MLRRLGEERHVLPSLKTLTVVPGTHTHGRRSEPTPARSPLTSAHTAGHMGTHTHMHTHVHAYPQTSALNKYM